jgi:hypothetical protein
MERCYYRHCQALQQRQDMAACLSPKNPVLMLQTHQIEIAAIEKIGGCPIRGNIAFGDLESHARGVSVRGLRIVDGHNR